MYCEKCRTMIGSTLETFGGYLCGNGHLICSSCFSKSIGLCALCGDQNMRLVSNCSIHSVLISNPPLIPFSASTAVNGATASYRDISPNTVTMTMNNNKINPNFFKILQNQGVQMAATNVNVLNPNPTTVHSGISEAIRSQMVNLQENIRNNAAKIIKLCEISTSSAHMQATNRLSNTTAQVVTTPTAPPMETFFDNPIEIQIKNCINLIDYVLRSQFINCGAVPSNQPKIQEIIPKKISSTEAVTSNDSKIPATNVTDNSNISLSSNDKNVTSDPSYSRLLFKTEQLELSNQMLSDKFTQLTEAIKLSNHNNTVPKPPATPITVNKKSTSTFSLMSQEPQVIYPPPEQTITNQKVSAEVDAYIPGQDTKSAVTFDKMPDEQEKSIQNLIQNSNKEIGSSTMKIGENPSNLHFNGAGYTKHFVDCLLMRNRILELENDALLAKVAKKSTIVFPSINQIVTNNKNMTSDSINPYSEANTPAVNPTTMITAKPTAVPESKESEITVMDNKKDSVQKIDKIEEALSDNVTLLFMTSRTETKSDVCMENIKLSTNYDTSSTESSIVIPEIEACNVSDSLNNYFENESSVLQDKICYRAECNHFKFREQRSISVSTDSAPSLNVGEEQIINQKKFLVMHELTEEHCISTKSEKFAEEIMDKRMDVILKTMNENAVDDEIIKESHKPTEITMIKKPMFQMTTVKTDMEETKRTDEEIIKIEAKQLFDRYSKVIEELNIRQQKLTCHIRHDVESNCDQKNIALLVSRAVRAYYKPCGGPFVTFMNSDIDQTPAAWQFRIISHPSNDPATLSRLVKERVMPNNISSYEMNLWRSPISCPDTDCIYKSFLSDFTKHLLVDHNHLPMERMYPRNVKNFFIDVRVAFVDVPKVRMLFLLQERITELGHNVYNDSLPLLIMTSVLRLSDIMQSEEIKQKGDLKYLLIWVSGLQTGKYPINMTLVAWRNTGRYPEYQVVITGSILPITKVFTPLQVLETGNCLLLTPQQQKLLTGNNLLHLQLFIH